MSDIHYVDRTTPCGHDYYDACIEPEDNENCVCSVNYGLRLEPQFPQIGMEDSLPSAWLQAVDQVSFV